MLEGTQNLIFGDGQKFNLEHRCYNGVCLTAGIGCLAASISNITVGMALPVTLVTFIVGSIYIWLYAKGRTGPTHRPILWIYILNGAVLLVITWFYNGGNDYEMCTLYDDTPCPSGCQQGSTCCGGAFCSGDCIGTPCCT